MCIMALNGLFTCLSLFVWQQYYSWLLRVCSTLITVDPKLHPPFHQLRLLFFSLWKIGYKPAAPNSSWSSGVLFLWFLRVNSLTTNIHCNISTALGLSSSVVLRAGSLRKSVSNRSRSKLLNSTKNWTHGHMPESVCLATIAYVYVQLCSTSYCF